MNKTQIEWVKNPDGSQGYTWNPITGCLNHVNGICKGGNFPCYAYRLANGRLKRFYLCGGELPSNVSLDCHFDPFYPRFWPERVKEPMFSDRPRGIFMCDMSDFFGDSIPKVWQDQIWQSITKCPHHRFYLLTKQPQNLSQWSPFPDNCYVGVTVTNRIMWVAAIRELEKIEAKGKYISLEPYLSPILPEKLLAMMDGVLDWLIIGALTGTKQELSSLKAAAPLTLMPYGKKWTAQPQIERVKEIVEAADKAGVPVFLKDNLKPLMLSELYSTKEWAWSENKLRQELPK